MPRPWTHKNKHIAPSGKAVSHILANMTSIYVEYIKFFKLQVIREHSDYVEMDPRRQVSSTVPTFRIMRSRPSSLVLVLDTSGSMTGARIQKLSQVLEFRAHYLMKIPSNLWYKTHQIPTFKFFSSRLAVVSDQTIEAGIKSRMKM